MYNPQLLTFLEVARRGSFTKAAGHLYISPSAVIQQINLLERSLGVTLFERTPRGIRLTAAGSLLYQEAPLLIARCDAVKEQLKRLAEPEFTLCIGTSMLEKIRLLYELWILFTERDPRYRIRLVSIDTQQGRLEDADLVEGILDHAPWQEGWNFMEICSVPLGCGVANDHPLAGKKQFTWEDLAGQTLVAINRTGRDADPALEQLLRSRGVSLQYRSSLGPEVIWECSWEKYLMLVPLCWDDILYDMTVRPCCLDRCVPYGIFWRGSASPLLTDFLQFIDDVYHGRTGHEAVPVL